MAVPDTIAYHAAVLYDWQVGLGHVGSTRHLRGARQGPVMYKHSTAWHVVR